MKSRRKIELWWVNTHGYQSTVETQPLMGQVKILKRGEALIEINNNKEANYQTQPDVQNLKVEELEDFVLSSTNRLGPEPEVLKKKISLADFYVESGLLIKPKSDPRIPPPPSSSL